MMAGAPGASGSLVIFSSSGEMGWKPRPARTVAGGYSPATRTRNIAQHVITTTRRSGTLNSRAPAITNRAPARLVRDTIYRVGRRVNRAFREGVTRLVLSGSRPGLQDDLLFIPGPDGLEKVSQGRVVLQVQQQEVNSQLARQMQLILAAFQVQAVRDYVLILLLPRWNASYLPTCGKLNGYVIPLLVRVFKIDGIDAAGVLEGVFFPRGENSGGNQHALAGIRRPPRNFQVKLGNQRCFRTAPIGLIGQFCLRSHGHLAFHA